MSVFNAYKPLTQRDPNQWKQEMINNVKPQTPPQNTSNVVNKNPAQSGSGGQAQQNGGQTASASNPYADYMAYLERQRAEQQALRDKAAEAARQQQQGQYNANVDKLNGTADNANKEAYVNYMLSKRDMGQQLSAQGLSGGAAESTYANLYNSYGNSRNNTEANRLSNLADLQQTLQNNLAGIEQQRLSGEQADIENYYSNLTSLAAQNMQQQLSMKQATGSASTDYSKVLASNYYKAYQDAMSNGYESDQSVALAGQNVSQYIYSLLASGQISQSQANNMMLNFGIGG